MPISPAIFTVIANAKLNNVWVVWVLILVRNYAERINRGNSVTFFTVLFSTTSAMRV
jgi:hypothetical protein